MPFMQLEIIRRGRLCTADCGKCGTTTYAHEWCGDFNSVRGAMENGTLTCHECGGWVAKETYWESPRRNWYAGRYSAPGYLDATEWSYGINHRRLARELRAMYGSTDEPARDARGRFTRAY